MLLVVSSFMSLFSKAVWGPSLLNNEVPLNYSHVPFHYVLLYKDDPILLTSKAIELLVYPLWPPLLYKPTANISWVFESQRCSLSSSAGSSTIFPANQASSLWVILYPFSFSHPHCNPAVSPFHSIVIIYQKSTCPSLPPLLWTSSRSPISLTSTTATAPNQSP